MKIFPGVDHAEIKRPTVLTLGVFDGLHLGHQAIVRTVVERASLIGATPTLITFDPHPRQVLKPETAPPLLQTFNQKMEGLKLLGVEQVVVLKFDQELAAMFAEDFVKRYIVDALQAREVYLGKGFAFGHDRRGNMRRRARGGSLRPASARVRSHLARQKSRRQPGGQWIRRRAGLRP